jgi:parallel beta-helix repeat protein
LFAAPGFAATFAVDSTGNSGTGTLRQAITDANGNGSAAVDEIPIGVTGNIDLLSALPNITTPTTITGPGANGLTVRRDASVPIGTQFRILAVTPDTGQTVTIQGMTISGARASGFSGGALAKGGLGTLILDSVWLTDNQASNGSGLHYSEGFTSIRNSTLSGNQSTLSGGAIAGANNGANVGVAEVINSTITGNLAQDFGGGIFLGGTGRITVNSSTIQGNTADSDNGDGGNGGGTYNSSGGTPPTFSVANTLYAGNLVGSSGSSTTTQCGGAAYTSSDYNLRTVSEAGCTGFNGTHDLINANPMLGTLGDNGGPTPTIPLLEGSPAINAGNPATPTDNTFPTCPAEDQRGVTRGGGNGVCDIGAFEWQHPTATTVACTPTSVTLAAGSSTCTATVTDTAASPTPVTTPTLNVDFATGGAGIFSGFGSCTLSEVILGQASCQVSYTPSAVGSGSHQITGSYGGDVGHDPSQDSALVGVVAPPSTSPPPSNTPPPSTSPPVAPFNPHAAIKKCKRKFPKGKKRKKCIKRAKLRAHA